MIAMTGINPSAYLLASRAESTDPLQAALVCLILFVAIAYAWRRWGDL